MSEVTKVLAAMESGDPTAADKLLPLVYEELRKLAAVKLAEEKPGQTLVATALVHEAYLRLVGGGGKSEVRSQKSDEQELTSDLRPPTSDRWNSRGHFFGAAAEAMRRILVESARRKKRLRHGGDQKQIDLDSQLQISHEADENLLALDEALERLAVEEPEASAVIKLRYFAGLTIEQTAQAMRISVRTANRHWVYARAWLYKQLQ